MFGQDGAGRAKREQDGEEQAECVVILWSDMEAGECGTGLFLRSLFENGRHILYIKLAIIGFATNNAKKLTNKRSRPH